MNRIQAINYLKSSGFSNEQIKAIKGAFTCEDAISRQAVERLKMARDSLKDAADELEEVHPMQPVQIPQRKAEVWEQRRYDEAHPVVGIKKPPVLPAPMCGYLTKVLDEHGTIIEKRCKVHMDMEYCGENCPYSTNVAYKTRSKPYLEKGI